jgi:hypothetical protein
MYACMYVSVYVVIAYIMYIHIYPDTHPLLRVQSYACTYVHMHTLHIYTCVCTYTLTQCCLRRLVAEEGEGGGGALGVCNLCGESLGALILKSQL